MYMDSRKKKAPYFCGCQDYEISARTLFRSQRLTAFEFPFEFPFPDIYRSSPNPLIGCRGSRGNCSPLIGRSDLNIRIALGSGSGQCVPTCLTAFLEDLTYIRSRLANNLSPRNTSFPDIPSTPSPAG